MKAEALWEQLFVAPPTSVDPHRLSSTLQRVFHDFQMQQGEHNNSLRLSSHNLLIVCDTPSEVVGLGKDLEELLRQYPGRAVVAVLDEAHQGPLEAGLRLFPRRQHLAGELLGLHLGADAAPLPSLVAPLWQDGLPTVMIYRGRPAYQESWFRNLLEGCTRLVVDTSHCGGDSLQALAAPLLSLWQLVGDPYHRELSFTDLNWARMRIWRDWIASLFDRPDRRRFLGLVSGVEIEGWAQPGLQLPSLSSLYLGAWLAHQLHWPLQQPLQVVPGGYQAIMGEVDFRFYARATEQNELLGRPVRVTLKGSCQEQPFRLSVERDSSDSSTLVLGSAAPGCGGGNHRLRLDRLNNLALMGHELETDGRDRVFEGVLGRLLPLMEVA